MKSSDLIPVLEIGTSNITITVGEPQDNGRVRISAIGSIPSTGVCKSTIVAQNQVRYSIDSVLNHLAKDYAYAFSVVEAYLVVSSSNVLCKRIANQLPLSFGHVRDEDVETIEDRAWNETGLPPDREVIDISPLGFGLDEVANIDSPRGMNGHLLTKHSLCIHANANRIADARNVAESAKIKLYDDIFFAGLAAAAAVLTPQYRRDGALVIDLGGGCTTYSAWIDGYAYTTASISVGGEHVTTDILTAFSISKNQAEKLKVTSASALVEGGAALPERISIPDPMPGFEGSNISRKALNTVVNARMTELFTIIRDQLDEKDLLHRFAAGIFLTGGGAALPDVAKLAANIFGCKARVATIIPGIEIDESITNPIARAVPIGVVYLINSQSPQTKKSILDHVLDAFGGIFGRKQK